MGKGIINKDPDSYKSIQHKKWGTCCGCKKSFKPHEKFVRQYGRYKWHLECVPPHAPYYTPVKKRTE